jgi:hypothetical protein
VRGACALTGEPLQQHASYITSQLLNIFSSLTDFLILGGKILGEMQISGGKPEKSRLQALRCWNDDQSFNNK